MANCPTCGEELDRIGLYDYECPFCGVVDASQIDTGDDWFPDD